MNFDTEPRPTEIDNHADTICFGKNFRPIFFTSEVCTVSAFLDDHEQMEDVPICTAATAYELDTGETIILQFGQGLWFGDKMDKSLINPNQVRYYGLQLCDDPTDPNRSLGIELNDEYRIPMTMNGTICGFISRCPSNHELESCRTFILSDDQTWDPNEVKFVSSVKAQGPENPSVMSITIHQAQSKVLVNNDKIVSESDVALYGTGVAQEEIAQDMISSHAIHATFTADRHHGTDPTLLAQKWGIGLQKAKDTLKCTTQMNIRSAILPLTRRYRTDLLFQRLRRLTTRFYTDTAFAKYKSILGNTCVQIFTDGEGFIVAYPMKSKSMAGLQLQRNCRDVGVPNELHCDNAPEMVGHETEFQSICRHNRIKTSTTEPHSPWQNRCENIIGVITKKAKGRRVRRRVPSALWDFDLVWECEIYSRTVTKHGRTGLEVLTGDTTDISEWIEFEFYDLVYFWDDRDKEHKPSIGRWLGVSHHVGSALCYWILTEKATIISRTTVQHLTEDEALSHDVQQRIKAFHTSLDKYLGNDPYYFDDSLDDFVHDDIEAITDSGYEDSIEEQPDVDEYVDNSDESTSDDTYDQYIGAEVSLPDRQGEKLMAKVMRKLRGSDTNDPNSSYSPLKDHSVYQVQFGDGTTEELTANVIAENMMSNIDPEGHHYQMIHEISDHKKDDTAISVKDGNIISSDGKTSRPKKTTRGWTLLVEWKDGSMDWIKLSSMKESFPVQVAEYAKSNGIDHEPAFNWWVHKVLRRRDRIINKVKSKYWRTSHKFGIRVPKSVAEAYEIDAATGTNFWTKAIEKEMMNVRIAFDKLEGVSIEDMKSGKVKPGYKYCGLHMIFDIKMDGKFTRKARLVADGHKTAAPSSITYSSVVSRDSVRIALMIASLNDLDLFACDIGNAYLNAKCREKLWTIAGHEFGSDKGSVMIIARALYGLKSSGAAWRSKLSETLRDMGYKHSESDPDVWMKGDVKPDGTPYYKYMLVYVDDILHIAHDPNIDMKLISRYYRLKEGSGEPDRYLDGNIEKVQLYDGSTAWSMTCVDYLKGAIANVDKMLNESNAALKNFGVGHRPYPSSYRPELDVTNELNEEQLNRFQQLIGILRWAIELGRIDIYTEVSCLSQQLCNAREGHLLAVYKIFRYLQVNLNKNPGRIVFDGTYVPTDEQIFSESVVDPEEWNEFYPEACEALPGKMIEPRGSPVKVRAYVDANHAGNLANRRSHTGIFIYVNNALITWYSKRQNTVESSSFGSEYVALRIATEMVEALRYKLRTFGIPIEGATEILCDNKAVVTNSSIPTSVLNKRHNAICYHRVREVQAAGTIRVGWIEGQYNLADLLTKTTMPGNVRDGLVRNVFMNNAAVLNLKTNA